LLQLEATSSAGGLVVGLPYRYCSRAADSTTEVLVVPVPWPPEPEGPPGAAGDDEAEGAGVQGPDATVCFVGGSGDADAEADDRADADAGADPDAEA
jgi:hypothetical protein